MTRLIVYLIKDTLIELMSLLSFSKKKIESKKEVKKIKLPNYKIDLKHLILKNKRLDGNEIMSVNPRVIDTIKRQQKKIRILQCEWKR